MRWWLTWFRCWLTGHREVVIGTCSNIRPHYCPKRRVVCGRCDMTHTDQGWLKLTAIGNRLD